MVALVDVLDVNVVDKTLKPPQQQNLNEHENSSDKN